MLLLVASLFSIFIAFLIIFYNFSDLLLPSNFYLSLFFFIFGIYGLAQYMIQFSASPTLKAIFFNHFTPLFACFGPAIFLYIKKVLNDDYIYLRKRELVHLIPFILTLIDLTPYLFSSLESKITLVKELLYNPINYRLVKHLFLTDFNASILRQSVNLAYAIASLVLLLKSKFENIATPTHNKLVARWILLFLSIMIMILMFMLCETVFSNMLHYSILNSNVGTYIINIYWIFRFVLIFSIFFFPSILYGMPYFKMERAYIYTQDDMMKGGSEPRLVDNFENGVDTGIKTDKKEYKIFTLDNEYLKYIDQLLTEYMLRKPYLNDKFGLSTLTIETKIPIHHLHIYFKEYLKVNFNAWKNEYKINYSKQLIENNMLSNMTAEAIASNSGFKSYSNYFTVFKAHTGMTPTEYAASLK